MMIGYKVTNKSMGSYIINKNNKAYVQYELNKKIFPKKGYGPLGVYDSLGNALCNSDTKKCRIFKCEYEPNSWRGRYFEDEFGTKHIEDFLPGTECSNYVKLIEEIRV